MIPVDDDIEGFGVVLVYSERAVMTSEAARLLPRSVLLVNLEVDQANRSVSENVLQVEVVSHAGPCAIALLRVVG